jgi:hypothetical protein
MEQVTSLHQTKKQNSSHNYIRIFVFAVLQLQLTTNMQIKVDKRSVLFSSVSLSIRRFAVCHSLASFHRSVRPHTKKVFNIEALIESECSCVEGVPLSEGEGGRQRKGAEGLFPIT